MSSPTTDDAPLSPGSTAVAGVATVPAAMADGRVWGLALAPLDPEFDRPRDALFDAATAFGAYGAEELCLARVAAVRLLMRAHRLGFEPAFALVAATPIADLITPVVAALFGEHVGGLTYSEWARAAFFAAGKDPMEVPPEGRRAALDALEYARLALPRQAIQSVKFAMRRGRRGRAR